jgi:hypothetical protein
MRRGMRGCDAIGLRRRVGQRGRTQCCREHTRHCQRDYAQPQVRPDPSLHLVPFVTLQPATSNAYGDSGNNRVREIGLVKYLPNWRRQ